MATSPIYSWPEPDNTDLVKNGALAIRTLGNAIDTTMATMTPKSTFTAKGSIAAATAASTPANLSVGTNGQVLTADSTAATGLKWAAAASGTPPFVGVGLTKPAQSIPNVTYTAVTWDGESFDTDAFHDNVTNNSRVTIPSGKAGKYLVTGIINFASDNTAGNLRAVNIYLNGSATGDIIFLTNPSGSTSITFSKVFNLSVSDYIQIFAYQNCGGSLEIKGTTTFGTGLQVTYLGA